MWGLVVLVYNPDLAPLLPVLLVLLVLLVPPVVVVALLDRLKENLYPLAPTNLPVLWAVAGVGQME